jgi:hypothetical protein
MEEETEKSKDKRGLRWSWEKLTQAKGKEEIQAILAEAERILGDGDVMIRLCVPPKGYLKLMGDACSLGDTARSRGRASGSSWIGRWPSTPTSILGC